VNPIKKYQQNSLNKQLLKSAFLELYTIHKLLEKGADLQTKDEDGMTVLDYARKADHIAFFLDKGLVFSNQDYLDRAVFRCVEDGEHPETLSRLIAMGGQFGYHAHLVHWVLNPESEASLTILLDAGADVNIKNWEKKTPLHNAIQGENINAVRLLLKYHARLDILDEDGSTPADLARRLYQKTTKSCYQEILTVLNTAVSLPPTDPILGKSELSFIHDKPELGQRITETFNFKSGIYREVVYCAATNTQSNTVVSFNALEDTRHLADAEAEFIKQGGVPEYALKKRLDKF
jgi:hypothetical protein